VWATTIQFMLYLQYLGEETHSKLTVEETCVAVAWAHTTAGLTPVTADPFVKATLDGLQRAGAFMKPNKCYGLFIHYRKKESYRSLNYCFED